MLPPTEDIETLLKFASLCRKSGRISQARSTLVKLLEVSDACICHERYYVGITIHVSLCVCAHLCSMFVRVCCIWLDMHSWVNF